MSCLWMSCVVHVVNVTVICLYCEYICMYRSLDWTYCWITDYTSFPYWFYILFLHSFICTSLHIYIGYYSCHIIDHSFACHVIIVRLSISISLSILLSQMYSIFLSLGWEHLLHLMSVNLLLMSTLQYFKQVRMIWASDFIFQLKNHILKNYWG